MKTYCFRLYFRDLDYMSEDTAEALYESGCNDCTPGSDGGRAYADFGRDADSLEAAIRSAVADVRSAGYEVQQVTIDEEDLAELMAA